ncbi:hypothetical protein OUZ56_030170 [Daphnia magna]|uniref:Uncharacterized protein n=1 Tax=Daphnia magna TaxID=35525 RepID=A0ABQ9ZQH4_9CRUS|nr:hypothetical protein OUZ56_030170 [Daphnia magna]
MVGIRSWNCCGVGGGNPVTAVRTGLGEDRIPLSFSSRYGLAFFTEGGIPSSGTGVWIRSWNCCGVGGGNPVTAVRTGLGEDRIPLSFSSR